MLRRRLELKLLAPIALISLILIGASVAGALYLNYVHFNATAVLSENVQSARAAARLETTAKELVRLLRGGRAQSQIGDEQIREQNHVVRELLTEAEALANLKPESDLTGKIADGLKRYLKGWDDRQAVPPAARTGYDDGLAETLEKQVLDHSITLRTFNMDEVERSDADNRSIVATLQWGMLSVGILASLGGLVLGYTLARRLHSSIHQLSVRIRDAAGRLNHDLGSVTVLEDGDLPTLHSQMQSVLGEIGKVVDQLHQREREVLRAEQLAAVGQIAAGVAHEIRNPLTSIKMLVQTGREGEPAPGLPAEDLAIIEHEVRRMEHCIQMFLDFARPPRTERRQIDLADIIKRATALVEGRARRQHVELRTQLPEQPSCLHVDPEQINQVLVNLLLNALDALPRGGTIDVALTTTALGCAIQVRDSGPGLSPAVQARLFEPFVSSKESGLGLGLSICRRLIEAHGGTISADNVDADGRGAVFTVTLPAGST